MSKKGKIALVCLLISISLYACGGRSSNKADIDNNPVPDIAETLPLTEQVDMELQGTWTYYDSDTMYTKYTFYDGMYTADSYSNGKLMEGSIEGIYNIDSDVIHTMTTSQQNNVEGSIPYTFENGVLTLNPVSGRPVEKDGSEDSTFLETLQENSEENLIENALPEQLPQLIEECEILDWPAVYKDIRDNPDEAGKYNNVLYVYKGKVLSANNIGCTLYDNNTAGSIEVLWNKEALYKLSVTEEITVIGRFSSYLGQYIMEDAVLLDPDTVNENFVIAVTNAKGNLTSEYSKYVYDSSIGQIISYVEKGWIADGTHYLTYDDNGNLIEDVIECRNPKYGTETLTYTYYEDGNKKTQTETYSNEDNFRNGTTFEYTYEKDENNRIIKETVVNVTSDTLYTTIYEYEYDDSGEMIRKIEIDPDSEYISDLTYNELGYVYSDTAHKTGDPSYENRTIYEYAIVAKR